MCPDPCLDPAPEIALTLTGSPGALHAEVVPSADPYNGVERRLDGLWTPGRPPIVTGSLPSTPSDGDEIYYLADATNTILWHLVYVAAEVTAYKWIVVSGRPLGARRNQGGTINPGGTNNWQTLGGTDVVGPSVELPLAGFYSYRWGCGMDAATDGQVAQCGITLTGSDPDDTAVVSNSNAHVVDASGELPAYGPMPGSLGGARTAGDTIILRYRSSGTGGTATYNRRWVECSPYKLG